ncbi:hypothetical protein NQ317_003410 [Molorchus minor]|uniref:Uncharacterized protein n=1 Tax=Molorchus minor TaxID=1323400 RepID=A0ABQ9JUU5_9CUCU|nr:hypothetical protein NQ317_003410 [Molorchus minor]
MAQGKLKVKTKLPERLKSKNIKLKAARLLRGQLVFLDRPIQPKKDKLEKIQKIKQIISKTVNKAVEEEIRNRAKSGQTNFSRPSSLLQTIILSF